MIISRLVIALASAAVAVAASATPAPAASAHKPSCSTKGRTLAIGPSARVFAVKPRLALHIYGCTTKARRPVKLGISREPEGVDLSLIAVHGRRVAYVVNGCNDNGCEQSVLIYDLKARQRRAGAFAAPGNTDERVSDIVLSRTGVAAWISEQRTGGPAVTARYVLALAPGNDFRAPPVTLATGVNILPGSLALARTTLYWTQGTARSAPLP